MVTICVWYGDPDAAELLITHLLPEMFKDPEETLRYVGHPRGGETCLVRSDGPVEWMPRSAVLGTYAWVDRAGPASSPGRGIGCDIRSLHRIGRPGQGRRIDGPDASRRLGLRDRRLVCGGLG